jgi:hypothetical protein
MFLYGFFMGFLEGAVEPLGMWQVRVVCGIIQGVWWVNMSHGWKSLGQGGPAVFARSIIEDHWY